MMTNLTGGKKLTNLDKTLSPVLQFILQHIEEHDKGLLDFAIVLNYVDLTKYNCLPMSTKDNWGVIFRNDDILSKEKSFSISDLRDLPLICSKQWVDYELPDWFEYNLLCSTSLLIPAMTVI